MKMKRIPGWIMMAALALQAQQPSRKVQFEEASVKPGDPNSSGSSTNSSPGRFSATNVTLKRLIGRAYNVEPYQIEGGPKWIQSEKFSVAAKLEDEDAKSASKEERGQVLRAALQNLLETRFQIQTHHESKTMPCFALVVAKGGPKLHEVEKGGSTWSNNRGLLTANKISMEDLASILSSATERPVRDMTGLKAVYELKLEWTPENIGGEPKPEQLAGPSIFTALQEQLGLKLETTKAPVEMLVIDRAEKPVEN
jgi:bla regulator protein BlaR1